MARRVLLCLLTALFLASPGVDAATRGQAITKGFTKLLAVTVPLIKLSSGSIAADGSISGITALGAVIPSAYCYIEANKIAASAAATFRYCTFDSTTTGKVYQDAYSGTGTPTIPTSPTAVTDGQGAFTGVTSAITIASATLGGGVLGNTGTLYYRVWENNNNSAGNKNVTCTLGGTTVAALASTTQLEYEWTAEAKNKGSQALQSFTATGANRTGQVVWQNISRGTVNTAAAQTVACTMTSGTATDNMVVESVEFFFLN